MQRGIKRHHTDDERFDRAKRLLVDSLSNLDLNSSATKRDPRLVYDRRFHDAVSAHDFGQDAYDAMDTSSPTTVFIPSIDEFLQNEEEEEQRELVSRRFLALPKLTGTVAKRPHFYEMPSKQLILYEPWQLIVWRKLYGSAVSSSNPTDDVTEGPDETMEIETDAYTSNMAPMAMSSQQTSNSAHAYFAYFAPDIADTLPDMADAADTNSDAMELD